MDIKNRHNVPEARRRRPQTQAARGFTLIELLVVIAIIGILMGLLFPAISGARARAVKTKCMTNLRSIQAACVSYATDNEGRFPTAERPYGYPHEFKNFSDTLGTYLSDARDTVMFCPGPLSRVRNPTTPLYNTHYTTYQYFNFPYPFRGTYASNKPNLTRMSTAPNAVALWGCLSVAKADGTSLGHSEASVKETVSGMNAAYPDGHVNWVDGTALEVFWSGNGDYMWPKPPPL